MAVSDAYSCVSWLFHTSTNTTFLSKATYYFSHMLLQRWEVKICRKEKSPQQGIKLATTRSWVWQAHHWATGWGLFPNLCYFIVTKGKWHFLECVRKSSLVCSVIKQLIWKLNASRGRFDLCFFVNILQRAFIRGSLITGKIDVFDFRNWLGVFTTAWAWAGMLLCGFPGSCAYLKLWWENLIPCQTKRLVQCQNFSAQRECDFFFQCAKHVFESENLPMSDKRYNCMSSLYFLVLGTGFENPESCTELITKDNLKLTKIKIQFSMIRAKSGLVPLFNCQSWFFSCLCIFINTPGHKIYRLQVDSLISYLLRWSEENIFLPLASPHIGERGFYLFTLEIDRFMTGKDRFVFRLFSQ